MKSFDSLLILIMALVIQRSHGFFSPYMTNNIVHSQPYYSGGWGPYHMPGPVSMMQHPGMIGMPPAVPPPPPIFHSGMVPVQGPLHLLHHPAVMGSPYGMLGHPHVFNPYLGNHWPTAAMHPSSYGQTPFGLHPFAYPGMGYPYGLSPWMMPHLSMAMMGSYAPMMASGMYPVSHISGAYGMYGPNNPLNMGEARKLLVKADNTETKQNKIKQDIDQIVKDFRKQLDENSDINIL